MAIAAFFQQNMCDIGNRKFARFNRNKIWCYLYLTKFQAHVKLQRKNYCLWNNYWLTTKHFENILIKRFTCKKDRKTNLIMGNEIIKIFKKDFKSIKIYIIPPWVWCLVECRILKYRNNI